MKQEKSCGAVVYRTEGGHTLFLVLRHAAGHWSFPKGHIEDGETEIETAAREILEETALRVELDANFRVVSRYSPKMNVSKEVVFFIAQASSNTLILQENEIQNAMWCTENDALELLTYQEDKAIFIAAKDYLLSTAR